MTEETKPICKESFNAGVKAMFDWLLYRAANNFHGDANIQKQCDKENELIEDWATDALEEISPEDCMKWRDIGKLMEKIRVLEKEVGELKKVKCI